MGLPSLLLCIVVAVVPAIQGSTPEYYRSIGQPEVYPSSIGEYRGGQGQGYRPNYEYGRLWCTCRRRCRYGERTYRYTCVLPFYPNYWNTCCKYLRNFQTSSIYGGYGGYPQYPQSYPGSMYGGRSPYQPDPQMSYPTIPDYGMGRLRPKGA